jgi:hypothetical protein
MVKRYLPYNLKKYFKITRKSQKISLSQLKTIRFRKRKIIDAKENMRLAYKGKGKKRKPISLRDNLDGTYTVIDGNSTVYVAKENNWKYIIAEIKEKR